MKARFLRHGYLFLFACLTFAASDSPAGLPGESLNVKLTAPIRTWDESVPLGNGLLGGLLWGETNLLRLSLDRGDLWDLRTPPEIREPGFTYQNLQRLVRERNQKEIGRLFDEPYNQPTPTKIPAGRLEIVLDPAQSVERFELNLATAEGRAWFSNGQRCEAFFSATKPVALLRITGPEPKEIRLRLPGSGGGDTGPSSHAVAKLGYPAAQVGNEGRARWFVQETAGPLKYCVFAESRRVEDATLIAVTVTAIGTDAQADVSLSSTSSGGEGRGEEAHLRDRPSLRLSPRSSLAGRESSSEVRDVLRDARKLVSDALRQGYDAGLKPHATWWAKFWAQSSVTLPEPDILRHYYLVRYFYGATSRRGAPPMPLQGVWTADAGSLPPWKGDYHNDLNTQMSYMGYQGAGHFEEGSSFLDFNWDLLPAYRRFARNFYGTVGANVPGVMSLNGEPLTGWGQYSLSPTMGPWIAHLFYLHWRYTGDEKFLQTRAYPWCRELGICLKGLLKSDDKGVLVLPLSSSPEIHDNRLSAWLKPNSNFDLACLKMLFQSLGEMATACGKRSEAQDWLAPAHALGDWHVNTDGALKLDANENLAESHRHLSNLMGLYPFDLITVEDGARERQIIRASLDQWDKFGTKQWCGYSFTWMSALRARTGDGEAAVRNLDIFVKAFLLRNGFHANGDQSKSGFSSFTYRPFTLEGNMLAAAAVHEMLLQSWRDTIRIFPAVPWRWHDVAFENLRAEGGHRVSARRENNATTWLRVVAGRDGELVLRDNFGGRMPTWNFRGVRRDGYNYRVSVKKGAVIEVTLPKPERIPEAPANTAQPVATRSPDSGSGQ